MGTETVSESVVSVGCILSSSAPQMKETGKLPSTCSRGNGVSRQPFGEFDAHSLEAEECRKSYVT